MGSWVSHGWFRVGLKGNGGVAASSSTHLARVALDGVQADVVVARLVARARQQHQRKAALGVGVLRARAGGGGTGAGAADMRCAPGCVGGVAARVGSATAAERLACWRSGSSTCARGNPHRRRHAARTVSTRSTSRRSLTRGSTSPFCISALSWKRRRVKSSEHTTKYLQGARRGAAGAVGGRGVRRRFEGSGGGPPARAPASAALRSPASPARCGAPHLSFHLPPAPLSRTLSGPRMAVFSSRRATSDAMIEVA